MSSPSTAQLTDTGLTNEIRYYYRISAIDIAGNESAQSPFTSALSASFHDTNPGLVGYWPFDEEGGSNIFDETYNTNHGQVVRGNATWIAGKLGNSMRLNEETFDQALIPHHPDYITNGTYTMSFWYYPISGYRKSDQFHKKAGVVAMGNRYQTGENEWRAFGSIPWDVTLMGFQHDASAWFHITAVYDPSEMFGKKVYVNGSLVASNTAYGGAFDDALNTDPIGFGSYSTGSSITASFDDFAIWDMPLNRDQIQSLWNEGDARTAYTPPPAGTVIILK